jgi:GTP pyrophosphokinase
MRPKGSTVGLVSIIKRQGNNGASLIEKAYALAERLLTAKDAEWGKKKLEHSLRAAAILSEFGFDEETVAATLLHDVTLFDCAPIERIESAIGKDVALILSEHSKMQQIEQKNFAKIDNGLLSQIILATAHDIRAIFVKIATRLDVLQNPAEFSKEQLNEYATVALNIYPPICHKLGLYDLKGLVEDAAFKALHPKEHQRIKQLVAKKREQRESELAEAIAEFNALMQKEKKDVTIEGRAKYFYAIYKKIVEQNRKFSDIFDLLGVRIICNSIKECYEVLGAVHSNYKLVPNKFSDYIANPKKNGYRSIHTVVQWNKMPLEVQIRTMEMHYEDESGVAAHWQYKQYEKDKYFDKKLAWARQLVEWHRKTKGSLAPGLKMQLGQNKIFVFTPKKQVIVLPEHSTPVDFAFAVHSDLGMKCERAKVNGKIVPLHYELQNTDVVEIMPSKKVQVKRHWLNFVKSAKAQVKIRQCLGIKIKGRVKKKPAMLTTTADETVRIAKCCNPLPGDEIIGFRTTKRKTTIHRKECENIKGASGGKLLQVEWDLAKKDYNVDITVQAKDYAGLLPAILGAFESAKIAINSTNAKASPNNIATCVFNVKINNIAQLENIIKKIGQLPAVLRVERA